VLIACVVWAALLGILTRGQLGYPRYRNDAEHVDLRQPTQQKSAPGAADT